jgi:sugar phosphate isomerase/epimerase
MIRSSVTVSLVEEARGGPFVYWNGWEAAAKAAKSLGFDAIEIFTSGPDAVDRQALQNTLRDLDLKLAAVGTGAGWVKHRLHLCLPDATQRSKAKDYIRSIIDFAGPFGAPAIIGSMQGRHGDGVTLEQAKQWLCEALDDLGRYAAQYQVPLIYEPLNRYETNLANTLQAATDLTQQLAGGNVKLLADLFHMNIEEADIAESIRSHASSIGHIHFVDSNRRAAGMGHLDWSKISAAIRDIKYNGYLSAEAFPLPNSDEAATTTIDTFRKHFA